MNVNDVKNFTNDLELSNQNNLEVFDSLNNISMDELKQKMNDYLENKSNHLDQSIINKDANLNDTKESSVGKDVNLAVEAKENSIDKNITNSEFESRTPLGKITIKNSVMENLSQNIVDKSMDLLMKNINKEKFFSKVKEIGKKTFEFIKNNLVTLVKVAGKLIKKI